MKILRICWSAYLLASTQRVFTPYGARTGIKIRMGIYELVSARYAGMIPRRLGFYTD